MNRTLLGTFLTLACAGVYAQDQTPLYQFGVNVVDLALYGQKSMVDDHITNAASLILNAHLKLKSETFDAGAINIVYSINDVNEDSQLDTSSNWMGGVGSYIGGAIAGNDISPTQLTLLTWDKKWTDDLYTSVGRTNLRRHFLYSNCGNAVLCTDPIKGAMGSLPLTYGYWGAYFKYHLNENWYVHSGIYEVNTDDYVNKKHGLEFSTKENLGETQVYSVGYQFNPKNKIEALYFNNNSQYRNAYTKSLYDGVEGMNLRFDYTLDLSYSPTIYGAYSYINEKNQAYKDYWELGVNVPVNSVLSQVGFKYGESMLNDDYAKLTEQVNGNRNKNTSFISIDTKFKYKNLTLSPFAQYIWNPDNYYLSRGKPLDNNLILGVFTHLKLY